MNDFLKDDAESARLKGLLKRAVQSEAVPPFLESRIKATIRAGRRRTAWTLHLVPVAAAVAVCLGAAIAYQLGHLRLTASSQESYIASVSSRVATLMRVGLGDHIHCSVFRKFPKNPPKVEDLAVKMDPAYRGLIPIVRERVPEDYRVVIAHQCSYHGRRFVHLSLKSNSRLLSLVITRKRAGESFEIEGMLPSLVQSGIPMYRAGVRRFEMASFETRDYLVYLVSDLSQQQNTEMMLALAPQVSELLSRLES